MPTSTQLDTRVLDAIIRNLDGNVANAVAKAAFAIEGRAKLKAPVDTGALRASIYVSFKRSSGFDDAKASATQRSQRKNGAGVIRPLKDENFVQLPTPQDDATAYVGPSVEYGAGVELGTSTRAGTPYLLPAVREVEVEFRKLLGEAVTNGK
jgi:hypothetical protein